MNTHYVKVIPVFILLLLSASMPVQAQTKSRLLFRLKDGASMSDGESLVHSYGLSKKSTIPQLRMFVVEVPQGSVDTVRNALARNKLVDFAEVDQCVAVASTPNDPYYANQWYLTKVSSPQGWDISSGSSSVVIAILDTGVDASHPDLAGKLLLGYNTYDDNYDCSDVFGHGTMVAGVIGAETNNGVGVASLGWSCSLLPIRVTDLSGYAYYSSLSEGIVYAADHGAKVASMSFAVYGASSLSTAAKYMNDHGGVVIAAGGNSGTTVNEAANPYVISVAATDSLDQCASFSTSGPFIDLAAPGVSIYTTARGGGYASPSGTSFSAPMVAALAGLLYSADPTMSPSRVESILEGSAVDLGASGWDPSYGWGRIDAGAALSQVSPPPLLPPPPPPDMIPPTVSIASPAASMVSGVKSVQISASDDIGVSAVEFYLDGVKAETETAAPYSFTLDTTHYADGGHVLLARAIDAAGNVGVSLPVAVTFDNAPDMIPPTVSITSPQARSTVSGAVAVKVAASDASSISRVEFYVDRVYKAVDKAAPYTWKWNVNGLKVGLHTLTVRAYNASGLWSETSITVSVTKK